MNAPPSLNVGVFGGTFDPPHVGHLIVAQDACLALGLDRILFIPTAIPPHKLGAPVTPAALRAHMLELAIAEDARFGIDTLELDRGGASYTVDTLRALAVRAPETRWTLLMGADQYEEFATWREPDAIRRLARIGVMMRAGRQGSAADTASAAPAVATDEPRRRPGRDDPDGDVRIEVTRIDVSATAIRRRVAAGLPIRYLVPRAVEKFIFEQKLYVRNGTPVAG